MSDVGTVYKYMSTTSGPFVGDPPDPIQPPGYGWEPVGQCAYVLNHTARIVWTWRQVSFTFPLTPAGKSSKGAT